VFAEAHNPDAGRSTPQPPVAILMLPEGPKGDFD